MLTNDRCIRRGRTTLAGAFGRSRSNRVTAIVFVDQYHCSVIGLPKRQLDSIYARAIMHPSRSPPRTPAWLHPMRPTPRLVFLLVRGFSSAAARPVQRPSRHSSTATNAAPCSFCGIFRRWRKSCRKLIPSRPIPLIDIPSAPAAAVHHVVRQSRLTHTTLFLPPGVVVGRLCFGF